MTKVAFHKKAWQRTIVAQSCNNLDYLLSQFVSHVMTNVQFLYGTRKKGTLATNLDGDGGGGDALQQAAALRDKASVDTGQDRGQLQPRLRPRTSDDDGDDAPDDGDDDESRYQAIYSHLTKIRENVDTCRQQAKVLDRFCDFVQARWKQTLKMKNTQNIEEEVTIFNRRTVFLSYSVHENMNIDKHHLFKFAILTLTRFFVIAKKISQLLTSFNHYLSNSEQTMTVVRYLTLLNSFCQ
ncbi:hypothetical protein WN51_05719 [Melipona quadrifasciata]|uniref:Uncharacterized protein n=1 Tax=Melipona quadrifasciata TaxID=166423 RepID=A0A0M9A829_9HYME|nr:hypothetical protein WN51_05719 [Melipona quadrifasciata]